ncbi:hypothetical protein ACFL0O_08830 [Thermodesulfobacteriota bacterium]
MKRRCVPVIICLLIGVPAIGSPFQLPGFVGSVPAGHFAGVGVPCDSMSDARRSAVYDVVRQVLGSIGVEYDYAFASVVSGDPMHPVRRMDDKLSGVAHGSVVDVERNIIETEWSQDRSGRHVCFILVQYPNKLIQKMRRLSKGSKVVASVISGSGGDIVLRVTEVNGVSVVLTSADVTVLKRNKYAKWISFYVWKVPTGSKGHYSVALNPVKFCGESHEIRLKMRSQKDLSDYLLGADIAHTAVLKGHDELSRPVSVMVRF